MTSPQCLRIVYYLQNYKNLKLCGYQPSTSTREQFFTWQRLNGNTKLAYALVNAGALINEKDGIGQSALTLALHKDHHNTARKLIECGSSVHELFYKNTIAPS